MKKKYQIYEITKKKKLQKKIAVLYLWTVENAFQNPNTQKSCIHHLIIFPSMWDLITIKCVTFQNNLHEYGLCVYKNIRICFSATILISFI